MRAGRLRHRVAIQVNEPARDDYGQKVDAWRTLAHRWAAVEPLAAKELLEGFQLGSEATHRVVLRYFEPLTSEHRISHNGRQLEIMGITNRDDRNIEQYLLCKEAL